MSAPQQVIATGSTLTGTGVVTAFVAQAMPLLQFAAVIVTIVVGVLTAVYTWKKIKARRFD